MKNLFLSISCFLFAVTLLSAQGQFRAGIGGGLPVGDAGDFATFAIAVDLGYLFEISDSFQAGGATGYVHSFSDDLEISGVTVELDDDQFIPLAGAARFWVSRDVALGLDVGFALGVNDGNDGGFYYAPRAQYEVGEAIDIVVSFRGISLDDGFTYSLVSAGVEFGID